MKIILFISFLLLVSCNTETQNAPDLVLDFGKNYLEPLLDKGIKKTLIVVLNPSECGSCEEEVIHFVNSAYLNFNSITIIPQNVQISPRIHKSKTIAVNRKKLAQHSLLNANGSVLVYEGKNCIYFSPIDLLNIDQLKKDLDSFKN